jgi:hypothetical protein
MASREVFHFDEFTLDVRERRLLRGLEAIRLLPKAYDVLVALVQQRGCLVTKDELLTRLWPGSFVEEGSLKPFQTAGGCECGRTRCTISAMMARISRIWMAAPATWNAANPKIHRSRRMTKNS